MIVVTLCILTLSLQQPWRAVDSALGRTGSLQGETYRVGFPRNDLHVTVGAVTVRPALALGSWVAFKQTKDRDRKSTRLNSSHSQISYAGFCLKKKKTPDYVR